MTPIQVRKVIGYTRVSTQDQGNSGLGLSAQRQRIVEETERRGWEVVWIEDRASAKSLDRPGLQRALTLLRRGEVEGLCVAKLDRLSRSMLDFAQVVSDADKQGWAVMALDLGVDTSTAAGEMLAGVMVTFAQYERRLISQRTKDGLAAKKAQGYTLGRPVTIPADVRARINSERSDGLSFQKIADNLNAAGIPTAHNGRRWYPSSVRAILLSGLRQASEQSSSSK